MFKSVTGAVSLVGQVTMDAKGGNRHKITVVAAVAKGQDNTRVFGLRPKNRIPTG